MPASAPAPFAHHELVRGADGGANEACARRAAACEARWTGPPAVGRRHDTSRRAGRGRCSLGLASAAPLASRCRGECRNGRAPRKTRSTRSVPRSLWRGAPARRASEARGRRGRRAMGRRCARAAAPPALTLGRWDAEVAYATAEPYLDDNAADDARDGVDMDNDAEAMDADGEGAEAPATERHADGGFGGRFVDVCGVRLPRAECSSGDGDADDGSRGPARMPAGARAAHRGGARARAPPACSWKARLAAARARSARAHAARGTRSRWRWCTWTTRWIASFAGTYACTKTPNLCGHRAYSRRR